MSEIVKTTKSMTKTGSGEDIPTSSEEIDECIKRLDQDIV